MFCPFLCFTNTGFSAGNARIRWSQHLVALEEGSRLWALLTSPSWLWGSHSLSQVCPGLFLPEPSLLPFLGKQITVISTVTALLLGNTSFRPISFIILKSPPSTQTPGFSSEPSPLPVALRCHPTQPSASVSALVTGASICWLIFSLSASAGSSIFFLGQNETFRASRVQPLLESGQVLQSTRPCFPSKTNSDLIWIVGLSR